MDPAPDGHVVAHEQAGAGKLDNGPDRTFRHACAASLFDLEITFFEFNSVHFCTKTLPTSIRQLMREYQLAAPLSGLAGYTPHFSGRRQPDRKDRRARNGGG